MEHKKEVILSRKCQGYAQNFPGPHFHITPRKFPQTKFTQRSNSAGNAKRFYPQRVLLWKSVNLEILSRRGMQGFYQVIEFFNN